MTEVRKEIQGIFENGAEIPNVIPPPHLLCICSEVVKDVAAGSLKAELVGMSTRWRF